MSLGDFQSGLGKVDQPQRLLDLYPQTLSRFRNNHRLYTSPATWHKQWMGLTNAQLDSCLPRRVSQDDASGIIDIRPHHRTTTTTLHCRSIFYPQQDPKILLCKWRLLPQVGLVPGKLLLPRPCQHLSRTKLQPSRPGALALLCPPQRSTSRSRLRIPTLYMDILLVAGAVILPTLHLALAMIALLHKRHWEACRAWQSWVLKAWDPWCIWEGVTRMKRRGGCNKSWTFSR